MKVKEILYDGVESTSLMTLFSYLVSKRKDKNYKEPLLLEKVVHKEGMNLVFARPLGWLLHYGFGATWSAMLRTIVKKSRLKPNLFNGIWLGTLGGFAAVACWKPLIKYYRLLPKQESKRFFAHLVLAHIVYTITLMQEIKKG